MKLDAVLPSTSLTEVPATARAAEETGFDAIWLSETLHDPFLPGPLIAEHTARIGFGTAIAVSFARSPGNLAYLAWDLAQASGGRFILGLGTQVKAHIERRFGMPWPESPVGQLREQVAAVRALWRSWQTAERLNHRGDRYRLTLMSPFFNPGPIAHPDIPIFIAGVNTGLARLAGETADGFLVHPFHTPRYLSEVLRPAIAAGAAGAGRSADQVSVTVTAFVITSPEEREFVRGQLAFYASTPSYRPVMALHGWAPAAEQLSALAARQQWADMPALISDEMVDTFATAAPPSDLAIALQSRYGELAARLALYLPFVAGERDSFWSQLRGQFR